MAMYKCRVLISMDGSAVQIVFINKIGSIILKLI